MKKILLSSKIHSLKFSYQFYGALFKLTSDKAFFDKKITLGVNILSIMALLSSCNQEVNNNTQTTENQKNDTNKLRLKIKNSDKITNTAKIQKSKNEIIVTCYLSIIEDTNIILEDVPYYEDTSNKLKNDEEMMVTCYEPVEINPIENNSIYTLVDEPASFPGGNEKMIEFLYKNLKISQLDEYPDRTTIYIQFTVTQTGKIENVHVLRGINEAIDQEALRVVRLFPNWIPAKNNGKNVKSVFNIPIKIDFQ